MTRWFRLLSVLVLFAALPLAGADDEKEEAHEPGKPDPALQKAIDQAIERGADWIRREQGASGGFQGITKHGATDVHHEIGVAALMGLALLAAGDERGGDPKAPNAVDKVYRYVMALDKPRAAAGTRATYDTGILLMFLTAYWRGHVVEPSRGRTRPGRHHKSLCNMPPEVLRYVQDAVNWLVNKRFPPGTWGYPGHREDNSNTQYAFLGIRAARDCGAKVPTQVFVQAARTLMEYQEKEGPKVSRIIPSPDPKASPYVIDCGDRARGWSYLNAPYLATGSMTTSGIAILAICHDAMTRPKRTSLYDSKMERKLTQAIQDGFSWLDKNWTVSKNPPRGGPNWHYYYLYGLERAAVFGGRVLIGRHDWYLDGARYLVSKQQGDGRWSTGFLEASDALKGNTKDVSDLIDTAWAILFLAKATRPMPPIQPPTVTEGD